MIIDDKIYTNKITTAEYKIIVHSSVIILPNIPQVIRVAIHEMVEKNTGIIISYKCNVCLKPFFLSFKYVNPPAKAEMKIKIEMMPRIGVSI